jgi:hypothetical protein
MQGVFFKTCGQTGTRSGSYSSLAAIEAFTEKLVGVRPMEVTRFILDVTTLALVMSPDYDLSKNRVLHSDAGKFCDVCCR